MTHITKTNKILLGLACCLNVVFAPVALAQTPVRPSIESFFSKSNFSSAELSPSGKYLSVIMLGKNGRHFLAVVDTANVAKIQVVSKSDSVDMFSAHWVNDERLYFTIADPSDSDDNRNGEIYAINRDGSDQVQIITSRDASNGRKRSALRGDYRVHGAVDDGSDDLLVGKFSAGATSDSAKSERLYRINSKTLELTDVLGDLQPKEVTGWILDKENQPRFGFSQIKDRSIIHYREPGTKDWVEMSNVDTFLDFYAYNPIFIDGAGQVYAQKKNDEGFNAVYLFDPKTRKLADKPFFQTADFDANVDPIFERNTRKLLGLRYESDAPGTLWLDPAMQATQKTVDDKLKGTVNRITCRNGTVCLVSSFSDQDPGHFFLFKPQLNDWVAVGALHTEINPVEQGRKDFYRFTARDGTKIPVYVTQPASKASGPRPAVVLVHGGPYVRGGHWRWNRETQFLASRGYVVIEADYRGSTGYGMKHEHAGWKQWGLAMQDDLADAANWAVAQGWVDKNRIAIAGASYGGYATLMGLIKHPEIFRCGVNWVGVTDINLMYSVTWSDFSDTWKRYGMPTAVGDQVKDAEQLRATSPLQQASRLKNPLLMAYGIKDVRVPLVHGTKFRDAVMQHNQNVEWVTYKEEGHGWRMEKNNVDFWGRVERFLEKNLAVTAPL
nr:alpha/beta fold hydrolase [Rhodoferax sp.]